MHVSASNVLLYMILYDGDFIHTYIYIYIVGLSLGSFVSYMNRNKMAYHLWW